MSGIGHIGRALPELPRVVLHRGGWGPAPMNSLDNLDAAIKSGADAVEFDIQRTKDGVLAVVHDPAPRPNTGNRGMDLTYEQLHDLGHGRVATLDEFLDVAQGNIGLNAEFKHPGTAADTLAAMQRHGVAPEGVIFSSFDLEAVRELRQLRPDLTTGVIGSNVPGYNTGLSTIEHATRLGAKLVASSIRIADDKFLNAAHNRGLHVYTYTPWAVNDAPFVADLLRDRRISGVIANQRDAAVAARDAIGRHPVGGEGPRRLADGALPWPRASLE